jgi:hypothetical protein
VGTRVLVVVHDFDGYAVEKEHDREYTNVSFLIDRYGIVRRVHRGGRYAPGDRDFEVMRVKIEALLAE